MFWKTVYLLRLFSDGNLADLFILLLRLTDWTTDVLVSSSQHPSAAWASLWSKALNRTDSSTEQNLFPPDARLYQRICNFILFSLNINFSTLADVLIFTRCFGAPTSAVRKNIISTGIILSCCFLGIIRLPYSHRSVKGFFLCLPQFFICECR